VDHVNRTLDLTAVPPTTCRTFRRFPLGHGQDEYPPCASSMAEQFRWNSPLVFPVEPTSAILIDRWKMTRHLPPVSNYRAIASAIGEELSAHFRPSNGLSPELQRLLRQFPCSSAGDLAGRLQRSHEMWLTDGETRRVAEISLRFLSH
jgi:hypothetical protein